MTAIGAASAAASANMRHHDERPLQGPEGPRDEAAEIGAGLDVQRRERLVEQQGQRGGGQRARQRDPLALASGEGVRVLVCGLRHPDVVEQGTGARASLARRERRRGAGKREAYVVGGGQVWEERVVLRQVAEPPRLGRQR